MWCAIFFMDISKEEMTEIMALIPQKRYQEAIDKLEPVVKEFPDNVVFLHDLGFCYTSIGKLDKGNEIYEKMVELAPNNEAGYVGLGFVNRRLGRIQVAVKALLKAIEIKEDNGIAWNELGEAYLKGDDYGNAKNAFTQAIQWGGAETDAETLHKVAQCELGLNNLDNAIRDAKVVLHKDPTLGTAYSILGTAYLLKEEWQLAVDNFDAYLKREPSDESAKMLKQKAESYLN